MLTGQALWGDGEPPDLDDDTLLVLIDLGGVEYLGWRLHVNPIIRADVVDLDDGGFYDIERGGMDRPPAWVAMAPRFAPATGYFPLEVVEHLTANGYVILPLDGHDQVHAIVRGRGEDYVGWIMPSSTVHEPTEGWTTAPAPHLPGAPR